MRKIHGMREKSEWDSNKQMKRLVHILFDDVAMIFMNCPIHYPSPSNTSQTYTVRPIQSSTSNELLLLTPATDGSSNVTVIHSNSGWSDSTVPRAPNGIVAC